MKRNRIELIDHGQRVGRLVLAALPTHHITTGRQETIVMY